ncbi:ABC transporter substrate-binding protein [Desulfobacterota bacterium AH_259_B03_O07]|nr:ABC transporter substrate-binding protein [Desulfobacterota bacterium AH_259_B03_O07]
MSKVTMKLGHSPDPDDAFMFYGIASGKVSSDHIDFVNVIEDIQSLNERALKGELEVTAVSAHAYLKVQDSYKILSCGASMGEGYGPIVVTRGDLEDIKGERIGVPGKLTTAFLLLGIYSDRFTPVEIPFDKIMESVKEGDVDAGLLIHEGQLTYKDYGLKCILDLGEMWAKDTSLPLPLGLNVVKRGFSEDIEKEVLKVHQESIEYGLNHKDEALDYALQFGRGMQRDLGEKFVLMYVNDVTKNMGEVGRRALDYLYSRAFERGLIKEKAKLDILGN